MRLLVMCPAGEDVRADARTAPKNDWNANVIPLPELDSLAIHANRPWNRQSMMPGTSDGTRGLSCG